MDFADFLRSLPPDCHLDALLRYRIRAKVREDERAMLGCCPCGFVRGEDVCPVCDLGIGDAARKGAQEVADLAVAMEARVPKKKGTIALTARPPNRHERRRAASRRWRG